MTIGSPLVRTGEPIPEEPEEPLVDQKDIPTQRSYQFSGFQTDQTEEGILMRYRYQTQPKVWALRAAYVYTPKLMNP